MSKVISAQLPDELVDAIEEEQRDDEPRSRAVRRVIESGVRAREAPTFPRYVRAGMVATFLGVVLLHSFVLFPDVWTNVTDGPIPLLLADLLLVGGILTFAVWFGARFRSE